LNIRREPDYDEKTPKPTRTRSGAFFVGVASTLFYLALTAVACVLVIALMIGAVFLGECARIAWNYVPGDGAIAKSLLVLKEAAHVIALLVE
jgi:hypothetical protein